jgi:hypothetical protein
MNMSDHRKAKADPEAAAADLELNARLPLSYQRPTSQAAEHYTHVQREIDKATGAVVSEKPIVDRKQRRTAEALERRKFKPATRPLNKRELREMYLDKYEDSLENAGIRTSQPRKKKKTIKAQPEQSTEAAPENKRLRDRPFMRSIQRATDRALEAIGL